jgi:hypothetical protein
VSPLSSAGALRFDSAIFHLREYFYPGCATAPDIEVGTIDEPPLYDKIEQWNGK